MFNSKTKSLLLVLVLVVATSGAAFAAAPTVDTETTDTSTTTELNDGDTQTYNATTASEIAWSADSANSSIEIMQAGETVYEASPDSYNSVSGTYYYNVSLADDGSDYSGLEVGAGENATLNVTFTNNTESASPDTTNISFTFENTESAAWIASENPETEDTDSGLLGGFSISSLNVFSSSDSDTDEAEDVGTVVSTDSTIITDDTVAVRLDTSSSNMTEAFEASTDGASEGDLIWSSYTQASTDNTTQYVPVYYQRANEDHSWLDTEEDTYATIAEDSETLTIHNPDALLADGVASARMDVTVVGDEQLGTSNAQSMLTQNYGVSTVDALTTAFGALDINGDQEFVTDALEA